MSEKTEGLKGEEMLARSRNGKIGRFVRRQGEEIVVEAAPVKICPQSVYLSSYGLDRAKRDQKRAEASQQAAAAQEQKENELQSKVERLRFLDSKRVNQAMECQKIVERRENNKQLKNHFRQSADFSALNRAPSGTCLPPMNRRADFDRMQIVGATYPGECTPGPLSYYPNPNEVGQWNEFPTYNKSHDLERGIVPVNAVVSGEAPAKDYDCYRTLIRGFSGSPRRPWNPDLNAMRPEYRSNPPPRMGGMGEDEEEGGFFSTFFSRLGEEVVDQVPTAVVQGEIKKQQQYTAPGSPTTYVQGSMAPLPPGAGYVERQAHNMGVPAWTLYGAAGLLALGVGLVAYKVIKK